MKDERWMNVKVRDKALKYFILVTKGKIYRSLYFIPDWRDDEKYNYSNS